MILPRGPVTQVFRKTSFAVASQCDVSDSSGQKHRKYSGSNLKNRKTCAFPEVIHDTAGKGREHGQKSSHRTRYERTVSVLETV